MAEGSLHESVRDGSDADFDIVCTPCWEDSIREEAVKYCPECQEYLCTTCARHHGRQKATRSHNLVDRDSAKHGSVATMPTKCFYHPDRNIEMFCGTHDMVYCLKCIATEHRTCSKVTGIDELNIPSIQQTEIERLQNDLTNIQDRLLDTDKKAQGSISCLEEQKCELIDKIEAVERSLVEHIGKLKHEAVDALIKAYTSGKDKLKSNIGLVANKKKEIENANSQLQTFYSMDASRKFVQMKLIQNSVNDAVKLCEDSKEHGSQKLGFTVNADLKASVMTATSLGHHGTHTTKVFKVIAKKEITFPFSDISDVCQLKNGTLILADWNNKKIKRLDTNYRIKDESELDANPMGMCCTGLTEIAVKMNSNKVQFVSIGSSMCKSRQISVEGGGFWGMAHCSGELWISTGSGINVYNTSGTLLKRINKWANGQNIFKSSPIHAAVSGETVIVTDNGNGAICLGKDGTVKREMHDGRLVGATGVCVSNNGTVFLSGHSSKNIVMFDKNGECLGELVTKYAGLSKPEALCFDNRRNSIIVTCYSSDTIVIFDISD